MNKANVTSFGGDTKADVGSRTTRASTRLSIFAIGRIFSAREAGRLAC